MFGAFLERGYPLQDSTGTSDPVQMVNWDVATMTAGANGYHLPTEMQDMLAAMGEMSDGLAANKLGIYDLSGNVWEFDWDWSGPIPQNHNSTTRELLLRAGRTKYAVVALMAVR